MGRPLKKSLFGPLATTGQQIQVDAWVIGDVQARPGFIVSQKGSHSYIVDTTAAGGLIGKCSLVNTAATAQGQMTLKVFPFGAAQGSGAAATAKLRVKTIAINAAGTGYAANDVVTVSTGTGTRATATVNTVDGSGAVTGLTLLAAGSYTAVPSLTGVATTVAPTGGTGLTVNLTLELDTLVLSSGGADYTGASVTLTGNGTATATVVGGVVTALSVVNRGTYTTIPTVTIAEVSSGAVEFASKLTAHRVATFLDNVYVWRLQGQAIVADEANIQSA